MEAWYDIEFVKFVNLVASTLYSDILQNSLQFGTRLKHPSPTNKGLDVKQKFLYHFANDKRPEFVIEESSDSLGWNQTTKNEYIQNH